MRKSLKKFLLLTVAGVIVALVTPATADVGRTGRDGTTSGADGGRDSGAGDKGGGDKGGGDKGGGDKGGGDKGGGDKGGGDKGGGGRGGHDPDAPGHERDPVGNRSESERSAGQGRVEGGNNSGKADSGGRGGHDPSAPGHENDPGGTGRKSNDSKPQTSENHQMEGIPAPSVEGGRAIPSGNPAGPGSNAPQNARATSTDRVTKVAPGAAPKSAPKADGTAPKNNSNSNPNAERKGVGADGDMSRVDQNRPSSTSAQNAKPLPVSTKTQQLADILAAIDSQSPDPSSGPAKPPFTATPLGQSLTPTANVTDNAKATRTKNSRIGGYPGKTRSQGKQVHFGLDDPSTDPAGNEIAHYTGTAVGLVTRAGPAKNNKGQYLGQRVTIVFATKSGTWTSTTMHHKEVLVKVGDTVRPGQAIAKGSGVGDQFKSAEAGKSHVHWEIKHNGEDVNPLSGEKIPKNAEGPKKTDNPKPQQLQKASKQQREHGGSFR